jgi:hypothetical protein
MAAKQLIAMRIDRCQRKPWRWRFHRLLFVHPLL